MRQYIKKSCLEMLETLTESHGEIGRLITKGNAAVAMELLTDCQQAAISVGGLIDEYEREDTDEVHLLEQYCELMWNVASGLQNGENVDGTTFEKNAGELLQKVSYGIEKVYKTVKEVVLLPYQASMWDSLESAWKKECAEPDTEVFVIPVPFYDRNPDGSLGAIHFDGMNLPKYVEFTAYTTYDIEKRHPERIYIHNPYDEMNLVTSVDPTYYSSVLKDQTEELVYIPYFVLYEVDPNSPVSLKNAEDFVALPAVVNAHRVIVQSENWRKAYIKIMTDYAGEQTRSYWEKKIEVEVSSKIERVRHRVNTDLELPTEWLKLTEKPDGTRRKIILCNTGVRNISLYDEKVLDKIERVFETFKEHRDEVVLLWRPHPLAKPTFQAMRPGLYERYEKIIKKYREEGWGIYDDSAELHRAIAVSDAYYGDNSSLVEMYKETGKPIMIQNYEM